MGKAGAKGDRAVLSCCCSARLSWKFIDFSSNREQACRRLSQAGSSITSIAPDYSLTKRQSCRAGPGAGSASSWLLTRALRAVDPLSPISPIVSLGQENPTVLSRCDISTCANGAVEGDSCRSVPIAIIAGVNSSS
jgi:hypothetical protein